MGTLDPDAVAPSWKDSVVTDPLLHKDLHVILEQRFIQEA